MRILLIRFGSLGDVVLATSVVEALASNDNEIAFVVNALYSPLLEANPNIKRIIPFYRNFSLLADQSKKFNPDLVFDLHVKWRSLFLSMKLGKRTIYTDKRALERRAMVLFKYNRERKKSVVDLHLSALMKANIPFNKSALPKLYVSDYDRREAMPFVQKTKRPIAVIHTGAKYRLKNWGEDRFRKTAQGLYEFGFDVIYFGENCPDFAVKVDGISLRGLKGILSSAELYVGNDSGPGHMASALGVPSISIFGPTHPALGFAPCGEWSKAISANLSCSPCTLHGRGECKYGNLKCFAEITPEFVIEEAIELWKTQKGKERFSSIEMGQ